MKLPSSEKNIWRSLKHLSYSLGQERIGKDKLNERDLTDKGLKISIKTCRI